MKKYISMLLLFVLLILPVQGTGIGAIAGQYYSTDIRTYLNGVEIDAINIGGKTLINAEDMAYYSFSVQWIPDTRELHVQSYPHASSGKPPAVRHTEETVGKPIGYYYITDIDTYLDGQPITAYNVGGRTYIPAEEMRDFSYVVDWNGEERTLHVTSPDRAGYEYTIPLTRGEAQTENGCGSFSVVYTKDGITGSGEVTYFDMDISNTTQGYVFKLVFFQNEGLAYSSVGNKLENLLSGGVDVPSSDPKEKLSLVHETLSVAINGQTAQDIVVRSGAGNGHRDYYIIIKDLPRLKKDQIDEIRITVGEANKELHPILLPVTETDRIQEIMESLRVYPNDFLSHWYTTDTYDLLHVCESASLGECIDRLYMVDRDTGTASSDLLTQVRALPAFQTDRINTFNFRPGAYKNRLFFSVYLPHSGKTGEFYLQPETGMVYAFAE